MTGGLSPNGKAALLAVQICQEEVNAHGGLLGRAVQLVYVLSCCCALELVQAVNHMVKSDNQNSD